MKASPLSLRLLFCLLVLAAFLTGLLAPSYVNASQERAPLQAAALDVLINEVAWAGTAADAADEWIELYNWRSTSVSLNGWNLTDGGDIDIIFGPADSIPAGGYYLLEAGDDNTIDIAADRIYTGNLDDDGEILTLKDDTSLLIDSVSTVSGWLAGGGAELYSMERTCVIEDGELAWLSNDGITINGLDNNSNPIQGTPGNAPIISTEGRNSTKDYCLLINEVAWAGTLASPDDEWIELYNPSKEIIDLEHWRLVATDSTPDINFSLGDKIPAISPAPGFFLLERRHTATSAAEDLTYSGSLNDSGETLRLRAPNGTIVDTANSDGGSWPAGVASTTASMERMGVIPDESAAWVTFNDTTYIALDAASNFIHGTPGADNWGFSVTHTPTPVPSAPLTLLINEVAWMGTVYSSNDEWIELYNPGSIAINLTGWRLYSTTDTNTDIPLSGSIAAGGYFVIAANGSVFTHGAGCPDPAAPNLIPNQVISLSLNNEGEVLRLADTTNTVVDTANSDGGAWPAGVASLTYATMERRGVQSDGFFAWSTYSNPANSSTPGPPPYPNPIVCDHGDALIKGTPGQANWGMTVTQTPTFTATPPRTATPTRTPTKRPTATAYLSRLILINEFLPRPGSDWNHDGRVDVYDEFIEVINADSVDVNLKGWQLDDEIDTGSAAFSLPDKVLKPGQRAVYYGLQTNILLSDGGDTVRLIRSNGEVADVQPYEFARSPDVSECQYPEGPGYFGVWRKDCFPTPGTANQLTGDLPPAPEGTDAFEPLCLLPDTLLEDFLLAECHGYGDQMWNAWFWDETGWGFGKNVLHKHSQWEIWIQ